METTAKNAGSMRDYSRRFKRPADSRRRIQCSGAIEELIAHIGFARSICPDAKVRKLTKALQMDLYRFGAVIAAPPVAKKPATISDAMMDLLDVEIHRLPNEGQPNVSSIEVYLSRLTDLLWLLSQLLESRPGINPQTGK